MLDKIYEKVKYMEYKAKIIEELAESIADKSFEIRTHINDQLDDYEMNADTSGFIGTQISGLRAVMEELDYIESHLIDILGEI